MIENHVTSLAISKRLGELGFNKGCLFRWQVYENGKSEVIQWVVSSRVYPHVKERYKAYLGTELLEFFKSQKLNALETLGNLDRFWIGNTSICNSLAKMVICILEELKQ